MNRSNIFRNAHAKTRNNRIDGWGKGKDYKEVFARFLKREYVLARQEAEPIQTFAIRLQYSEKKLRRNVKALGFRWDSAAKVWRGECKMHQLDFLPEGRINTSASNKANNYPKQGNRSIFGASSEGEDDLQYRPSALYHAEMAI